MVKRLAIQTAHPRAHKFSMQLRKLVRGGFVADDEVALSGSIEPVHNVFTLAEKTIENGAKSPLLPAR